MSHGQTPILAMPNNALRLYGKQATTDRFVSFFNDNNTLTATVSSNCCGANKHGKYDDYLATNNELQLTTPSTKQGWYKLQQLVRLHFSPFEYL